ncbi:transcription elongation factor SPT6 [Diaphorina citri]|uniref:Transcription elongation factor SPT6 n=1 Tax=Diaphorina citri TaxID=121845 RepID=A0A3Q0IVB2_DIACI|nr:transcription elongation factor SPT6 [Diaphorina citri]
MADFIDSEAEESEEEEELNEQERKKVKRIAMESSDEDEDDEDKLREELEDLIDDAPIEDDDESDDENRKRKISDDELDDRLEDDDYDLIEENLGMKVQRKKQFKRLKRIEDDESDEDGNEAEGHARDKIANELFDSGDEEADRSSERRSAVDHTEAPEFEEGEGEDYSDADDFIVDDNDKPIAAGKKKKAPIFSDAALQEAQDIFGVEFDFDEFERFDEDEEYSDEDEEDEYLDEETEDDLVRHKKKKHRRKVHKKSIFEIYEPSELKRGHFTDLDNEIRNADIPERMQLREVPVTSVPEGSDELDEEAKWIYNQVYAKPSVSTQDCEGGVDPRTKSKKGTQTIGKIKKALDFMRNQQLEVPFIAFYRKEYVLPELTISDLWKVYKYDAKWCQLKSRKGSLQKLYENMRDYQNEILTKDLDAPIPDDVRLIRDEDIEWIKKIQTPEEVKDMQHHFFLYYAHEIPAMQEFVRKKERERRLSMPKEKKKKTKTITNDDGEEEEVEVTDDEEGESQEKEPEEEPQHETVKPANRCGPYSLCRKANIIGFAKRFGLTPEQFGEHLRDNYQRHDLDQEPVGPLELAKEYISAKFTTPDDVLKAGKYVVATQLSREPLVVKCVREILFERAKISVTPTKRGMKEIDESHPIYTMKYLNDKPVRDLVTDQYLKLHIAEQDKLIKISVCEDLKGLTSTLYLDEVKQLYYRSRLLRNFINTKKPHVIAVSGESREALMIQKDLEVIIKQLGEDEEFPEIKVEIVDNEFSKIYANSIKGESDFKEYPILLRQAISLARRLQDPLMEFSQLCTSDDEIMCLRYHPLQDTVSKDDLLEVITLEFVNRTNEVGVDLNEVVQNPYASNLVQFICGLGPRKGAALIKLMKQTNLRLENRTLLVTKCHMGPKVFINCAGFIKIDTDSLGSTDAYVEVLDGSRVHPETYEWARKMAVDALEDTEDPVEDTNPAGALEEILKEPDKLKELDLDAFAEELERQVWNHFDAGGCPGQATGVRIRLDNGITGYIHIKKLSDSEVTNPEDRVTRGQTIHCRIIKIDTERFYVEATSRTSDLNDTNQEWSHAYFYSKPRLLIFHNISYAEAEKWMKTMDQGEVIVRPSSKPRLLIFHNISYAEAEKWMKTMDQGEVIVRPSSKGADHLTVTWKVADDLYQHIDVREEGKENSFSLGRSLWIGTEEFEDLDEIIARHVSPMAANVRELLSFRYYREECGGMRDKAEEVLRQEKRNNPNKIHYFVSLSKIYQSLFCFIYCSIVLFQRSASNNQPSDPNVWAKAAAEWAKAKPSCSSSARSTPRYDARTHPSPRAQPSPRTHPSYRASPASSAPSPSASPAFSMRSGASGRGAGAGPMDMSPYSPRTPRTIASPRSMVESSIGGDMATPLYDE